MNLKICPFNKNFHVHLPKFCIAQKWDSTCIIEFSVKKSWRKLTYMMFIYFQKNPRLFPFFVYWTCVNQVYNFFSKCFFLISQFRYNYFMISYLKVWWIGYTLNIRGFSENLTYLWTSCHFSCPCLCYTSPTWYLALPWPWSCWRGCLQDFSGLHRELKSFTIYW